MADKDTAIKVQGVSKNFLLPHQRNTTVKTAFLGLFRKNGGSSTEVQHALKDVSFEVKKGEFFGIVGRNGSGKSTMLKMLAGIYQPTKGKINVEGKLVPFIELGVGFNPELSGRDNVYLNGALLGFSDTEIDGMYDDIVQFAELEKFMDQKLKNYSSGMQVRLAFSMAIKADADVLLVDEVLAVGDADFQRKCFEYFKSLKKNKKTVVFVSHDMGAVREFCDRAVLIDKNKLQCIGAPSEIAKEYSLLFMDSGDGTEATSKERWGNGAAQYKGVEVKLEKDKVRIRATIHANQEGLGKLTCGLHITSADGSEVTAMNNRMINAPDVPDLTGQQEALLTWELLNVFSDGTYFVTLTMVDEAQTPLDWYIDASSFKVKRSERSTTAILPPVTVKSEIIKE